MGEERASEKRASKKRPGGKIGKILLRHEPNCELRICRSRGMRTSLHWRKTFWETILKIGEPAAKEGLHVPKGGSANEVPGNQAGEY